MNKLPEPVLYLVIRMVTLAIRFLFVALFFRYSEALYGEYGLVATTVALGVYLLGMEFYTFSHKQYLQHQKSLKEIGFQQGVFYLFFYLLTLPLFYLLFYFGFLDFSYIVLFYVLLVAEHLSYELYRLLLTARKPFYANLNLFFRNGFWMIPLLVYFLRGRPVDIKQILTWWIVGDVLSYVPFILAFRRSDWRQFFRQRPDFGWIKTGILAGLPYFLAIIAYKVIEFSDRYFLDYFYDKATVGVYTFFGNMSVLVSTVVVTTTVSLLYPGLLESMSASKKHLFPEEFRRFKKQLTVWTLATALAVLASVPVILYILGKSEHLQAWTVLVLLVLSVVIYNLSLPYHYVLYGTGNNGIILRAALAAMLFNLLLNGVLIPRWEMKGAAVATLVAMMVLYVVKWRASRSLLPNFK